MQADHIIKFPTDHPLMTPSLLAIRLSGSLNPNPNSTPVTSESLLKATITLRNSVGQMPKIIKAKHSVAGFKLRKGADLLLLVTIRQKSLLSFLLPSILLRGGYKKGKLNGKNIQFGLVDKGLNVNIFLKGDLSNGRGDFFKSLLLIP